MEKYFKLLSGLLAFFVYFGLIGLLLTYFNHRNKIKSVHYSQKSSKAITVSLAPSLAKVNRAEKKSKPKKKSPPKVKPKKVTKSPKSAKKKKIKSVSPKPAKITTKSDKKPPKKRLKVSNLFDKVNEKKPKEKPEKKSVKKNTKKRKSQDRGIKNTYFASVEGLLQNWPSQNDFAGETIKVWLKINRDGSFVFKILSASNNEDFNRGLIQYLQQLQGIGFGAHQNSKPYELNVEFVAKE